MQAVSPSGHAFKKSVEGFVRDTLSMVRTSLKEDTQTIDNILAMLSSKFKLTSPHPQFAPHSPPVPKENLRSGLEKLQREVDDLTAQNTDLSERLFDLGQKLVQEHCGWMEQVKGEVERKWDEKLLALSKQWTEEKLKLESQLEESREKCRQLESARGSVDLDEMKKRELTKYLQSLEDIYGEVEMLKAYGQKGGWEEVEGSLDIQSREDVRSEQYYSTAGLIKEDQSTVVSHKPRSPRNHLPPPQQHNLITIKHEGSSKYRPYEPEYPVSQHYRGTSREPRSKPKPPTSVIVHCHHSPTHHNCHSPRHYHNHHKDRQIVDEKNRRLQAVELKLQGLRRQLRRQFDHQKY